MFERILRYFGYERRRAILWPHNAARRHYREISENQRLRLEIARLRKKLEASRAFSRSLGSRFVSAEKYWRTVTRVYLLEAYRDIARRELKEARATIDAMFSKESC
jgi:hypothetical protein